MQNSSQQSKDEEIKDAVPVLHQYREKFKSRSLSPSDLPQRPPRPPIDNRETAEERSVLELGNGVELEV